MSVEQYAPYARLGVTFQVVRSAGSDGAVVVFLDTATEPDGSDGGRGLRVFLNDEPIYVGVPFRKGGE